MKVQLSLRGHWGPGQRILNFAGFTDGLAETLRLIVYFRIAGTGGRSLPWGPARRMICLFSDKSSIVQVTPRLIEFCLSVHDDGTAPRDGLVERFT